MDDERGTRPVYEVLAAAGRRPRFGVDDELPPLPDGVTAHTDDGEERRRSWFVVSTDCPGDRMATLCAREIGPNEWTGFWTFDPSIVDRVDRHLRERYWD